MSDLDELLHTITARRAASLERGRISLQVVAGRDAGKRFDFDGRARIGTRNLADFVLTDPRISGLHCELTAEASIIVRDLGSKNGTWIGGVRVLEAVVPPGESLQLGDSRVRVAPQSERVSVPLSSQVICRASRPFLAAQKPSASTATPCGTANTSLTPGTASAGPGSYAFALAPKRVGRAMRQVSISGSFTSIVKRAVPSVLEGVSMRGTFLPMSRHSLGCLGLKGPGSEIACAACASSPSVADWPAGPLMTPFSMVIASGATFHCPAAAATMRARASAPASRN